MWIFHNPTSPNCRNSLVSVTFCHISSCRCGVCFYVPEVWFECLVMGRDGFVVPGDIQLASKKKTAVSSWVLMNDNGESTILDVDKYVIMRRVHIHARDLRILDPLLSYPSTILGRERAIVLNLEVNSWFFFPFAISVFGLLLIFLCFFVAFFFSSLSGFSTSKQLSQQMR